MKKTILLITISTIGLLLSCSKDKSLSIQDYNDLGVPSIDTKWGISEYQKCLDVLKQVRQNDFHSLPQLKNEKTKEIFVRIVSPENIDQLFIEHRQGKLKLKDFHNTYQELIVLYLDENEPQVYYHEELAEFFAFLVKTLDATFLNFNSLPNIDTSSYESKQLRGQMINGYKNQITALLERQTSADMNFTESDIDKLSVTISESLIKQRDLLDNESRIEIKDKLKDVINLTSSKKTKDKYLVVMEKL